MLKPGADPGFQVREAHLKKMRRAEGGTNNFGVFCVKNHDFTPKNHIFSNFRGRGALRVCFPWIRPWKVRSISFRHRYAKPILAILGYGLWFTRSLNLCFQMFSLWMYMKMHVTMVIWETRTKLNIYVFINISSY
jgi:hypothetical protein